MIHTGKCPKCDKMLTRLTVQSIEVSEGIAGRTFNGVTYQCPWCNTVLGAGMDPLALKTDTINGVLKGLGKL